MKRERVSAFLGRHRVWIWTAILLSLAALIFWLIWAQPWRVFRPNDGYRYVVGLSQQDTRSSRQIALKKELQQAALDNNQLNLLCNSAGGVAATQARQIEAMLEQRADAIIVDTSSVTVLRDVLGRVREAGIPLVLIGDESMADIPCDALLVNDYRRMGNLAATYFASMAQKADRLLEVQGVPRSVEARTLQEGLRQGLAGHGEVICIVAGYHSRATAGQRIQDSALATSPFNMNAVFAHDTELAFGALDSLGDIPVVCVQYEAAAKVPFDAVVLADPGGQQALGHAMALLEGKRDAPLRLFLPAELKALKEAAK